MNSNAQAIPIRRGDPARVRIELRDLNGDLVVDTYDGSESLAVRLWAGDDRAPALEGGPDQPSVEWEDAPAALVLLDIGAGVSGALDRGRYRIELLLDEVPAWSGWLDILAAPGEATEPPSYATYDGMLRRAGAWLPKLQGETGQAAFIEERHEAWQWTHRQVVSRVRSLLERRESGYLGDVDGLPLVNATASASPLTTAGRVAFIGDLLADGALIVDHTITEANEHYAIGVVLGSVLASKDDGDKFARKSAWHMGRANALLSAATFRVDVAGEDEEPDIISVGPC